MITVEQFKPQLAAGLNDLAAKLMPPATPSLYSAPPTNDPTGTLFFINVKQVACLIHKPPTPDATTIVVLQKDIPSPINTLLRLPAAVESFDSLITRLPYSVHVERRARDPKSKIAINSEAVISVSPLDLEWTNIVVLGSVRRSAVANTTAAAGGNHDPNSENVNTSSSGAAPHSSSSVAGVTATLQGVAKQALETAKYKMNDVKQGHRPSTMRDNQNTFAFQVAMDFVSVLRALDADGF
ncbi:hypothetical protein BDR26DRAFT_861253 [Obelidium mucronatum]|nr:hypothetical protein BDR26DRAFT_861253 [Obelidium mucronatum]